MGIADDQYRVSGFMMISYSSRASVKTLNLDTTVLFFYFLLLNFAKPRAVRLERAPLQPQKRLVSVLKPCYPLCRKDDAKILVAFSAIWLLFSGALIFSGGNRQKPPNIAISPFSLHQSCNQ